MSMVTEPMDLREIKFDPSEAIRIAPNLMVQRRFLPLLRMDGILYVAARQELDASSRRFLERQTGCSIEVVEASEESIRFLQERLFGDLRQAVTLDRPAIEAISTSRPAGTEASSDQAVEFCDQLLKSGIIRQASDIHLNVTRSGDVQIRLRIDGVLVDDMLFPAELRLHVFNRIKVLGGLDISEKRAAQDGSFRFDPGGALPRIEVRVATIPARHGERITLRLLSQDVQFGTLNGLGLDEDHRELFARAITLSHGMILLTGPTGSGKSTTLYAAIKYLLEQSMFNVMTVEDPIEYEIDGVTQTEVDARKEKVSFASSLRSILRHDPDVVMLGEIRDRETAELAVRAALTGHLVLSTLHTNTALGAVTRLLDLGVDRFLIASVLRLVAAQRLVRRLCRHCAKEDSITAVEARLLRDSELEGKPCWRASGCLYCAGRGFIGRKGLFEVVPLESDRSEVIAGHDGHDSLERAFKQQGVREHDTLLTNGIKNILEGETTVEEVLTVTAEFVSS